MADIFLFLFSLWSVAFIAPVKNGVSVETTPPRYHVQRLMKPLSIDADWNKKEWKRVKALRITNFIREIPSFHPVTEVKMLYDKDYVYVIFRVKDRFVRSITTDPSGQVWKDAAVEFFFCPDTTAPEKYFNLEANCGGTALLGYRPHKPAAEDVKTIVIAHSLPQTVDPEISEPVTWTLEYKVPLDMLSKYSNITRPDRGVKWKANFCKIAENNSNPHHMTWSPIDAPNPNFHMPRFFGQIEFE